MDTRIHAWSRVALASICLAPLASGQAVLRTHVGPVEAEFFGSCVVRVGDVDLDGQDDYAVGGQGHTSGGISGRGIVRVYSGATGTLLHSWIGDNAFDLFGWAIAPAGDVDGDGWPDVAASAVQYFNNTPNYVRVFSGRTGSLLREYDDGLFVGWFGKSIANLGDVTGDGVPDMAVGSPDYFSAHGRVYVFSGSDASVAYFFDDPLANRIGDYVAAIGDVTGDGKVDFAVTGSTHAQGPSSAGVVWICSGADGAILHTIHGQAGDYFGWGLQGVGDVDADGFGDLMAGGRLSKQATLPGYARVLSGSTGATIHTFQGVSSSDRFGWSVGSVGDVDADGRTDLGVGAIQEATVGVLRIYSGLDGSLLQVLRGSVPNGHYGFAFAAAGNLDADPFGDYVVGARFTPYPGGNGTAYVYSSHPTPEIFCAGDDSATPCPCGNTGSPGHGCDNAFFTGGGALTATGTPDVQADTIRLTVSSLPTSTTALFFQGTSRTNGGSGVTFGDGLRCVSGTIVRLGIRPTVAGVASMGHGIPGDLPLSIAGGIGAGLVTRHYQVWYRNVPNFCTPETYNLSNGATLYWWP